MDLTIYVDIGVKKRQVLNVTQIAQTYGAEYCTALLGLYVFTGEDVTSAFKGKGKVRPLKKLQSFPNHISGKNKIGDQIRIQQILDELKFRGVYRPETFHFFSSGSWVMNGRCQTMFYR